jgi:type II secretory ATPase GspE/PulE/Tfp pilus assembly ATPase PilB-like protein
MSRSRITAIKQKARESGTVFLRRAALQEVFNGITTLREANRVTFVEVDG